ncbi:hypothetical protein P9222_23050 [Paenibacillus amylolyticus]|nr:hypothetical protein [Paenibacillus amylolyticus]WFR61319.1 hypothetical protein P9222_23050 [Paenibacillus amylolyticus]
MFGWKWVWGGGYSISEGLHTKFALNYMNIPKLDKVSAPFPMLFGDIVDPTIKRVTIEIKQNGKLVEIESKLVEVSRSQLIWYVFLPPTADLPYTIQAYNVEGELISSKRIEDANDSGSLNVER